MRDKQINIQFGDWTESIDELPDGEDLDTLLGNIALHIGKIIIEFNSLEDTVSFCIKEIMSRSAGYDEMVYVFLSEMRYNSKVGSLVNLYGQMINACEEHKQENLRKRLEALETRLREASARRNRYAHASWTEISSKNYVRVKTKAKKGGVFHSYRRFETEDMMQDCDYIEETQTVLSDFDELIWLCVQTS